MNARRIGIIFHSAILLMIALPLLSLVTSLEAFPMKLSENRMLADALMVSGKSSLIMMIVVLIFGTPAAYLSSRLDYRGKQGLEILLDLPLVLPPAVAGLLLLMTFGKNGLAGDFLYKSGIQIPFSMAAVVLAQLFVALPVYIKTAADGFNKVDRRLERTAMTLGDTKLKVFFRITLPIAKNSLLTGAIMAWARGIAEFGATIMFAGNMPAVTQTLPLAIYSAMETDMAAAMSIARIMVILALTLLMILYRISRKGSPGA